MVSREELVDCYRYILGRSPEHLDLVESHMPTKTLSELRHHFPRILCNQ